MSDRNNTASERLESLTPEALASMGAPHLAYVGAVDTDQGRGYGIHSAEGRLLAVLASREIAFATARQNNLEPVSVH